MNLCPILSYSTVVTALPSSSPSSSSQWTSSFLSKELPPANSPVAIPEGGGQEKSANINDCNSRRHSKGRWTLQEDSLLIDLVESHGQQQWVQIATDLPGRSSKQCRDRWQNHLRPDIKKEGWSVEEELLLIQLHEQYGNKWAQFARKLPGRSDNAIKNHWNAALRRKSRRRPRKMGEDNPSVLHEYIHRTEALKRNNTTTTATTVVSSQKRTKLIPQANPPPQQQQPPPSNNNQSKSNPEPSLSMPSLLPQPLQKLVYEENNSNQSLVNCSPVIFMPCESISYAPSSASSPWEETLRHAHAPAQVQAHAHSSHDLLQDVVGIGFGCRREMQHEQKQKQNHQSETQTQQQQEADPHLGPVELEQDQLFDFLWSTDINSNLSSSSWSLNEPQQQQQGADPHLGPVELEQDQMFDFFWSTNINPNLSSSYSSPAEPQQQQHYHDEFDLIELYTKDPELCIFSSH